MKFKLFILFISMLMASLLSESICDLGNDLWAQNSTAKFGASVSGDWSGRWKSSFGTSGGCRFIFNETAGGVVIASGDQGFGTWKGTQTGNRIFMRTEGENNYEYQIDITVTAPDAMTVQYSAYGRAGYRKGQKWTGTIELTRTNGKPGTVLRNLTGNWFLYNGDAEMYIGHSGNTFTVKATNDECRRHWSEGSADIRDRNITLKVWGGPAAGNYTGVINSTWDRIDWNNRTTWVKGRLTKSSQSDNYGSISGDWSGRWKSSFGNSGGCRFTFNETAGGVVIASGDQGFGTWKGTRTGNRIFMRTEGENNYEYQIDITVTAPDAMTVQYSAYGRAGYRKGQKWTGTIELKR
jgi:hypothetical protein